jgi:hypothetical protein
MAISQSKYINIVSSIGGGSSVNQRDLMGRVFTSNYLVPVNRVLEFSGGKTSALSAIADYFGITSAEYVFANRYFSFSTAANTEPQKISFARYNQGTATNATLISGVVPALSVLQAITAGTLSITVGTTDVDLTDVNLSSATSYADVATLLTTAFDGGVDSVVYDTNNKRFVISSTSALSYATGTVAEAIGWTSADGILSEASEAKTPLETISESAELSNNFFSFCFLDALTSGEIETVAQWTDSQNVKYMYSVSVNESNYEAIQTAVKDYDGVALTLDLHNEHAEFMPMSAFAAVDYTKPNSTMDVFYKQFDNVTPSVTSNAKRYIYDPLRINYYGTTQQAGQAVSFYQDGVLQGSIPSMTVYANEAWLKDAFITDILNMRMGLDSLPANNTGKSLVMSALMETVNLALSNGVVLAGKELTGTQKAYITTITGDEDGWIAVQNSGYRLSAEIEQYQEYGITKYKISFLFVYSKGDTINYVDGRDILI